MFLAPILATLWPSRCAACATFVPEGASFCPDCEATLVPLGAYCSGCAMPMEVSASPCPGCQRRPFPFAEAAAALAYGGSLTSALLRFKHGGHRHLSTPLARYLSPVITPLWQRAEIVCPVPLHRHRLRARGFNQAWELLRASRLRLPKPERSKLVSHVLARMVDTPTMGHGSPVARARAVAGAFEVPCSAEILGRRVLVVDDVMTSGATLAECARTLLAHGASKVTVAALARAI